MTWRFLARSCVFLKMKNQQNARFEKKKNSEKKNRVRDFGNWFFGREKGLFFGGGGFEIEWRSCCVLFAWVFSLFF